MHSLAERAGNERLPRGFTAKAEEAVLCGRQHRMHAFAAGDSGTVAYSPFRIYLIRTSTMIARDNGRLEAGWKAVRGSVETRRVEESLAMFAEMAAPGCQFEGVWQERTEAERKKLFEAVNGHSRRILELHANYAAAMHLTKVTESVASLATKVTRSSESESSCVLPLGWGGGLLTKSAYPETGDESYRKLLRAATIYDRALKTGLPFPKTRRIVFEGDQPATLPGWVQLEIVQ